MLKRIERQTNFNAVMFEVFVSGNPIDILTTAEENTSFYLQCLIDRQIWRKIDKRALPQRPLDNIIEDE